MKREDVEGDVGARGFATCAGLSALRGFLGEVSATLRLQLLPVGASLLDFGEGARGCDPGGVGEGFCGVAPALEVRSPRWGLGIFWRAFSRGSRWSPPGYGRGPRWGRARVAMRRR